ACWRLPSRRVSGRMSCSRSASRPDRSSYGRPTKARSPPSSCLSGWTGEAALFFALGWAATGIGAHVAALVLTGFTLPRAVFLLLGGVLGDRIGPRRLLLACTAIVGSCCFLLAVAVGIRGVSAGLLLTT